jgi:hypothetical protein
LLTDKTIGIVRPIEGPLPIKRPGFENAAGKIARFLLIFLMTILSLIPFNYLQFIKINFGHRQFPFYYPLITGVALSAFFLAIATRSVISRQTLVVPWLMAFAPILSSVAKLHRFGLHHSVAAFLLLGPMTVFSTVKCFRKTKEISWATQILMAVGTLVSVLGIGEALIHRNVLYHHLFSVHNFYYQFVLPTRGGIASTIGHPLPLGAYLVLFLPLPFALRKRWGRRVSLASFAIVFTAILATLTRSSWIASFFVLAGVIQLMKKPWKAILFTVGLSTLLFLWASQSVVRVVNSKGFPDVPFFDLLKVRLNPMSLHSEIFRSQRSASYDVVSKTLRSYPLLGVGYGNYRKVYGEVPMESIAAVGGIAAVKELDSQGHLPTPDNQFLRWTAENGLIGFFTLFLAGTWFLTRFINIKIHPPSQELLSYLEVLSVGAGGFLINLMALDGFFWLATNFTFWFTVGLALALMEIGQAQPSRSTAP